MEWSKKWGGEGGACVDDGEVHAKSESCDAAGVNVL